MREIYQGFRLDNGKWIESTSFYSTNDGRVFLPTSGRGIYVRGKCEHDIISMESIDGEPIFVEVDARTFGKKVLA